MRPTTPCTPVSWRRCMHALQSSASPLPCLPRLPAPPTPPAVRRAAQRRVRGRGRRVTLASKLFKALLECLVSRLLGCKVWRRRVRWQRRLWGRVVKERVFGIWPAHWVLDQRGFERLLRVLAHGMAPPVRSRTLAGKRRAGVLVLAQGYLDIWRALSQYEPLSHALAQESLSQLELLCCHTHLQPTCSEVMPKP